MDNKISRLALSFCVWPVALMACGGHALAQQYAEPEGLEIVVTAQKRSETLRETPIAITVIPGDVIEERGLNSFDDIAKLSPSFRVETGENANDTRIVMRGISASAVELAQPPSVGVYVDGVYQSGRAGLNVDLLDVAQIEVLRGPQGTIFGRNTAAGALNITTRRPPEEFEARINGEVGNFNYWRAGGAIGGPVIGDSVFGRIAAYGTERDGFVDNTFNSSTLGGSEGYGIRGALLYDGGGAFTAALSADFTNDFVTSNPRVANFRQRSVSFNSPHDDDRDVAGVALTLTYDFGGAELTAISGYRTWDDLRRDDLDASPLPQSFSTNDVSSEALSQELRLASAGGGSFDWLVGLYASDETIESRTDLTLSLPALPPAFPPSFVAYSGVSNLELQDRSSAVFGNVSYRFGERYKVTLGGRYTEDEREVRDDQTGFIPSLLGSPFGPVSNSASTDYGVFTGTASVSANLTPRQTVYASIAQGYRAGGANVAALAPQRTFDPEESINYEIGLKSALLDNRMTFAVAAFAIEYTGLQVFLSDPTTFANYTANSQEARSFGVEAEVTLRVTESLTLSGGFGVNETEYTDFRNCDLTPITDCSGNALQNAPDTTASLRLDYEQPFGGVLLFTGADISHTGKTFLSPTNSQASRREPYALLNAELGLRGVDRNWSLSLWGRNIFDQEYVTGYLEASPFSADTYVLGTPRTFGARAARTF